jgi:aspartyl-tRNA(Asn)/glutamyl-tRNA(Gln) amidotransferase subunit A
MNTLRIGYAPVDFDTHADPDTRAAFASALDALRSLGVRLVETKLEDLPYGLVTSTVISVEGASVFEELIESGRVDQLADAKQIAGLRAGLDTPARDYLRAMRIRRLIQQSFRRVLTNIDMLLAPARYGVAPKVGEPLDRSTPAGPAPAAPAPPAGMRPLTPAGNLAGLPALCLPCGLANGLPVAIQLVARPFMERLILAVGMQFQQATDWHRQRPKGF